MSRLIPMTATILLVALLGGPAPASERGASSDPAKAAAYKHYAACTTKLDAKPAHRCPKKGTKGAFFKSINGDATYKICVKFPSGKRLCAGHQGAPEGKLQVNSITSHKVGQHVVTWYVAGKLVGTFKFKI